MTCIVATKFGMVADSYIGNYYSVDCVVEPKIRRVQKNILFGFSGSVSPQTVMLDIPERNEPDAKRWLVKSILPLLKDATGDFNILVVIDNRVFSIFDAHSLREHKDFACAGSGADVARGVMHGSQEPDIMKRAKKAVQIAAKITPYVCGPFQTERVRGSSK